MTTFLLADNQDISREGLKSLCNGIPDTRIVEIANKHDLIGALQQDTRAVVVVDYTLFDFNDASDLLILHQRFPLSYWILFSEELSDNFLRRITAESMPISLVRKSGTLREIDEALRLALRGERYVCRLIMEQILSLPQRQNKPHVSLTPTEVEILREIALGKTTKEIAAERNSSFHTVNTHRKNIFRKLEVNTAYEAIRYALRAGLIDTTDYYI